MIVAIDGPAGAGKSSAARALARRLGFRFLDTGAMYRAVTLAALRRRLSWDDPAALARLANELTIELGDGKVLLDGEDVTQAIRTLEITSLIYHAADNPDVRRRLVEMQRQAAEGLDIVSEGRDQGTVVFPNAECKIFLTATAEERAKRRSHDLAARGESLPFDEILRQQNLRDERDARRAVGPLVQAADAIELNTDGMEPGQVVDRLEEVVRSRMAGRK
jgi:cytidylate kinase